MSRVLVFAGSSRRDSFNKRLAAAAAARIQELGGSATLIDLADYPIPLYDGDLEAAEGLPTHAARLRDLMLAHQALVLACPEYNGSITPLLKNTLDWTSRASDGVPMSAAYKGNVAALVSASPGALGGLRGLAHVRAILGGMGVVVVPGDLSVGGAHQAFADDGRLADDRLDKRLSSTMTTVLTVASALRAVARD